MLLSHIVSWFDVNLLLSGGTWNTSEKMLLFLLSFNISHLWEVKEWVYLKCGGVLMLFPVGDGSIFNTFSNISNEAFCENS